MIRFNAQFLPGTINFIEFHGLNRHYLDKFFAVDNINISGEGTMACNIHPNHEHNHGESCGHLKVKHGDHYDYLHYSHLHHPHDDHVDEHVLEVSGKNPDEFNKKHRQSHVHDSDCEHESVAHGYHIDYIVDGRLHRQHEDHCDDHGEVEVLKN